VPAPHAKRWCPTQSSSPVADYRGHDQIAPVLDALTRVVRVTGNVAVHRDDAETVWFFTAEVEANGPTACSACAAPLPPMSP
jgi:hypothetical protein